MTIRQEVSRLKMKYQTDDPYEICEYLDIQVMDRPMGKSPRSCKGFFSGFFSVQTDCNQQ